MLHSVELAGECVVLATGAGVWTVAWPEGYEDDLLEDGSAVLRDPTGQIVATEGDWVAVNGEESGVHPLCMIGTHFTATRIVHIDKAADSTSSFPPDPAEYVAGELIVRFCNDPSRAQLRNFENRHELVVERRGVRPGPALYLFAIQDGVDAAIKRPTVAADSLVCRVSPNWLGEVFN